MSIPTQTTPKPQLANGRRAGWSCSTAPWPSCVHQPQLSCFWSLSSFPESGEGCLELAGALAGTGVRAGLGAQASQWGAGIPVGSRHPGAHSCRWLRSPWAPRCSHRRGPGSGRRRGGSRRALPGAGRRSYSSRSRPGPGGTRAGSGVAPRGSSMVSGTAGHTPAEAKPSLIQYRLFFGQWLLFHWDSQVLLSQPWGQLFGGRRL